MGIVRRCGRPPRPGPLIQKPTRERMQLLGRAAVAPSGAGAGDLDALASLVGPRRDSRELDARATARLIAATPVPAALTGRPPPRIPAALGAHPGEIVAHGEREVASDDIVCGCPGHRR
jgi:hypothetical protein